jgi:heme-degrading monooxygenase HmoA
VEVRLERSDETQAQLDAFGLDVILTLRPRQSDAFEAAFREAQQISAARPGYQRHELRRYLEADDQYLLLVWWNSLESHTEGFRRRPPTSAGARSSTTSTIHSRPSSTTSSSRALAPDPSCPTRPKAPFFSGCRCPIMAVVLRVDGGSTMTHPHG